MIGIGLLFSPFMDFWYRAQNFIESLMAVIVIIVSIAAIFGVVYFSIFKLKKINRHLAIVASAVISCFLMIPIVSSFNNYVRLKVGGAIIDEAKAEIRAQRAEAARLRAENRLKALEQMKLDNQLIISEQTIEVQTLNDNMKQLEQAQLSMQSFQRILELALLETNLKQTMVRNDRISEVRGLGILGYNYDEILAIINHDITAKFGIDLNDVRVAKLNETTVVVSGIRSKFIGTSKNISSPILSEIRRVDTRGGVLSGDNLTGGTIDSVTVQNSREYVQRAIQLTSSFETDFQRKLSDGLELSFMDDAVAQLAKNFITVMLAPLYGSNISFDNAQRPDSLPIMQYLERELRETNALRVELNETNRNLVQTNEQLEIEIKAIESSLSMEDGEMPL